MYVKATVYLPVNNWGPKVCNTYTRQIITLTENGEVRKEEGSYNKYNTSWSDTEYRCGSYSDTKYDNFSSGCGKGCKLNYSWPTNWCVKSGSSGSCVGKSGAECGSDKRYTQKCYWVTCPENEEYKTYGCNSGYSGDSDSGCGSERHYCYYTSSSFTSDDKSNWKKSLAEAGGYAKKIYVYSYPQRVYINYEGNGATSICGDGNTASWASGTNSYNSNTSIKYELGNPVCNTAFTSKNMAIASNSNSTTYISVNGGNLKENEYYRIGYDFKGWALIANGTVKFSDKQYVTATSLNAKGGDTITLYAVWQKHDYKVTYSYLCGSINNVTYQYGTGVTLNNLDTTKCESGSNTKFLGWYEDIGYTKKLGAIPTSYYKDITLYAKERQVRYFNYQQGKWIYTTK